MKAGKVGLAAAQVVLGLLLAMEVICLVCFFMFLVPAMVRVLEEADAVLPRSMLLVLNVASLLRGIGGSLPVAVLAVFAVGWMVFELVCRSEVKPLVRLIVGGSVAVVLAAVALWVWLVSVTTLRQVGRQDPNALLPPARPALHAAAPRDAPPGAA